MEAEKEARQRAAALDRQLETLESIARIMSTCSSRQQETLKAMLETLERKLGMANGSLTLSRPGEAEISLGASKEGQEADFICIPILLRGKPAGTLSACLGPSADCSLSDARRALEIAASLIAAELSSRMDQKRESESLESENSRLRSALAESFRPEKLIGSSSEMKSVFIRLRQVAASDTAVLISGEPGTGKELIASTIHYSSARAAKPFVKVNCASFNESLLESELFGHEAGYFSRSYFRRGGRIEEAAGGTLFLEEIGELPAATQAKLLRVLQEGEFERLGGSAPAKADIRMIASTTKDLEEAVREGSFRQDLFYKMNVFPIRIPPLRARRTDILALANHFVKKHSKAMGKTVKRISTPAINMLLTYYWPGNVGELESCIEHALVVSADDTIHGHDYPPTLQMPDSQEAQRSSAMKMKDRVKIIERDLIVDALKRHGGSIPSAAEELGISGRMVRYKIHDLSIDYEKIFGRRRGRPRPALAAKEPS